MKSRIYKEVSFDASHRLLTYTGKCASLHGHRWKVEVWIEGDVDERTGILMDYNLIKQVIERFDHQVVLNEADPMVACLSQYQDVVKTAGDPTSELLAATIADDLNRAAHKSGLSARVARIRVWESPSCCAELSYEGH
ncbi:MAG: 6-carboxytetrahydropterin synthase [Methanomicrobiales archaeon]|nr:6-carboxytetrahydropterin synthase [Methanomicrobiales archaeon]